MNAYIQLTLSQLRFFVRNRQVLVFTLFMPLFFMLMLGSFLGKGNDISLDGVIIDQDHSAESSVMVQALQSNSILKLKSSDDLDKSLDQLKNGDQKLVVLIQQNYGHAVGLKGADSTKASFLQVYYDQTNQQSAQIGLQTVGQVADGVSKQLVNFVPTIRVEPIGVQALQLRYIDFLVPGILAMMIMSNNLNGVSGQIASWRERGVLRRMQSTPLKASTFIAAQITARLVMNTAQALIVLLVGALVFGTQVNGSWWLLLLFVVMGTLTFMSIGFIIAGVAKTPESAGPIAGLISFPLMFLGGVFFSVSSMPSFLQPIVKSIPITQLSTAIRQIMNVGAGIGDLWQEGLMLAIWLVVAFVVATFTFKWE
ncbi:ABC transporter permease [Paenibacillus pectinilyticus]|uniref:Transport permease protein n=1 Tax=Paenibacillus pectinilyticus TaxID=512399 RepID=A0A1C0ZYU1_9BACL|nr:ABC transporter permease [Paenibacillus pectinilyticus]OCT13303.1 ABC transporter permease [Paenibacillus pectinilyticus]